MQSIVANEIPHDEFEPYFKNYIDKVGDGDVRVLLAEQVAQLRSVFDRIADSESMVIHPPYQWTLKQVAGHLIDVERIFGCRAHRIACAEDQPLPGFDQDRLVANADYDAVVLADLIDEFEAIRDGNLLMCKRWSEPMWIASGICDGKRISTRAISCLLVGHVNHHLAIVKQRLGA